MGLTIKEISIDNWNTYLEICEELIEVMVDMFVHLIPEIFCNGFFETILDLTYCLNIFGKILTWCTIGVLIFIISITLIFVLLCIIVVCAMIFILYGIIGIILYLPSILIRWIYQRTITPFFRMAFIKRECKNRRSK